MTARKNLKKKVAKKTTLKKTVKNAKKTKSRRPARIKATSKATPVATVTTTTTVTTTINNELIPKAGARKTLVSFLLDETGSMQRTKSVTINGFNEYLQTLKAKGGDILFTLTKFNTVRTDIVHSGVPLERVAELTDATYRPEQGTPLYDAIGRTIASIDAELAKWHVTAKPAVLLVIMTDGEDTKSREFNRQQIFDLIKQKEAAGWGFIYLGANQNAYKVAEQFGVSLGSVANYHESNVRGAFAGVASATSVYTKSVTRGEVVCNTMTLSAADRSVIEQPNAIVGDVVKMSTTTGGLPLGGQQVGDVVPGSISGELSSGCFDSSLKTK